jgi:hypothetical protein
MSSQQEIDMFHSSVPHTSRDPVPAWAKELLDYYLPTDWQNINCVGGKHNHEFILVWNVRKMRNRTRPYGTAWRSHGVIECNVFNNDESEENVYLLLHEISHVKRGPIPIPPNSFRKNRISHDVTFFRLAAETYLDYDVSILKYATENEYESGKHVMVAALKNVVEFKKNPMTYPVGVYHKQRSPNITPHYLLPMGVFEVFTKIEFNAGRKGKLVGKIVGINHKTYQVTDQNGAKWRVPFNLAKKVDCDILVPPVQSSVKITPLQEVFQF